MKSLEDNADVLAPGGGRVSGSRLGVIIATEPRPVVDFSGNLLGPQTARVVASLTAAAIAAACEESLPVLLLFEQDDATRPVIIDIVVDHPQSPVDVVLKGSRVVIEADVELVLKSGACVVRLDSRGKAVTTAEQIVSRARGTNKVQGGSIQLN